MLFLQLCDQGVKLRLDCGYSLLDCFLHLFLPFCHFLYRLLCLVMLFIALSGLSKRFVHFFFDSFLKLVHVVICELLYAPTHFKHLLMHLHVGALFNNCIELVTLLPLIYKDLLFKLVHFLFELIVFVFLFLFCLLIQRVFKCAQIIGGFW